MLKQDAEGEKAVAAPPAVKTTQLTDNALPGAIPRGFLLAGDVFRISLILVSFWSPCLAAEKRITGAETPVAQQQVPPQSSTPPKARPGWAQEGDEIICRSAAGKVTLRFPMQGNPRTDEQCSAPPSQSTRSFIIDDAHGAVVMHFENGPHPTTAIRLYDNECRQSGMQIYPGLEPLLFSSASDGQRLVLLLQSPHGVEPIGCEDAYYVGSLIVIDSAGREKLRLDNAELTMHDSRDLHLVGPSNRYGYLSLSNEPGPKPKSGRGSYVFFDSLTGNHHIYRIDEREHPRGTVHISAKGKVEISRRVYIKSDGSLWQGERMDPVQFDREAQTWKEQLRTVYAYQFP